MIGATGDVVCQFGVERRSRETYDPIRTGRFFLLTSCYIAPILSRWMVFLETRIHGNPRLVPLKRVLVDQVCFCHYCQYNTVLPDLFCSSILSFHYLQSVFVRELLGNKVMGTAEAKLLGNL